MTKKTKFSIISLIIIMAITSLFIALFNSPYLTVTTIVVNVEDDIVPPTIVDYLKKYDNKNIFRINCDAIKKDLEENPFIESANVKITISKKLRINLKKAQVNAIIYAIENESYALLSDNGIFRVNNDDKSLIDNHLIMIEMHEDVLNTLLKKTDFGKFNLLVENLELLNDSSYLISSVKYDNNINNSFGFFKLELENTNTEIRVREQVDSQLLIKAIEFAQKTSLDNDNKTVLDIYHGAIIERSMPFGG